MKDIFLHKRSPFIFCCIAGIVLLLTRCINNENEEAINDSKEVKDSVRLITYKDFAGTASCTKCHKEITNDYVHTAHYLTSQQADKKSIQGSFAKGKNSFVYDDERTVKLEKRKDSFYQVYYYKGEEKLQRTFDVVIGSGTNGETYLSWVDGKLIELPVSYFTQIHQWANSPGYPLYPTVFNRPATARCLECHATFATLLTNENMQQPENFDSTQMILTVSCEKCHGPAAKHVAYQLQHPNDTTAKYIVNPAKLSRTLSIDVCALCHSGGLQKTQPSFQFTAGDSLSKYFDIAASQKNKMMDVHGNQLGLLSASKCFRNSQTMTCIMCHDTHKNERNTFTTFSQKCMTCHTTQHKTIEGISNTTLMNNCIDCHMPLQESMSVSFLVQGKNAPVNAVMRTHYITVYQDETKKYIQHLSAEQKKKP